MGECTATYFLMILSVNSQLTYKRIRPTKEIKKKVDSWKYNKEKKKHQWDGKPEKNRSNI